MSDTTNVKSAIDERLEQAIQSANYRISLQTQKQNARLKYTNDLTHSENGGIFSITPELISFISALVSLEKDDAIILDINFNPVEIQNLRAFQQSIISKYYEVSNEYFVEYRQIQKSRNVKSLVGV